jgi:hypothetical protein
VRELEEKIKNEKLVIAESDKGGKTCILTQTDYLDKLESHFNDTEVYEKLERKNANPMHKMKRLLADTLKPLDLERKTLERVAPAIEQCDLPEPYGLIKVHKTNNPARVIIPYYSMNTYQLAKEMDVILKPAVNRIKNRCDSSIKFVKQLHEFSKTQSDCKAIAMASFDVAALFDNVSIEKFLEIIPGILTATEPSWRNTDSPFRNCPTDKIVEILKLVLQSSYFRFKDNVYRQKRGCPMGSPLSVAVAEIYMDYIETEILKSCPADYRPLFYIRYIDDIFLVFLRKGDVQKALNHFNGFDSSGKLRFTCEMAKENEIPFLDVVVRQETKGFTTFVYRKPTHANRFISSHSNVPQNTFTSVMRSMRCRALRLCSNETALNKELAHLAKTFVQCGHDPKLVNSQILNPKSTCKRKRDKKPWVVIPYANKSLSGKLRGYLARNGFDVIFKKGDTLRKGIFKKHRSNTNPHKNRNVVYRAHCTDCNLSYVGKTTQKLQTRLKQHKRALKKGDTEHSALVHHCFTNDPKHDFDTDTAEIVTRENDAQSLLIKETLFIRKHGKNLVPQNTSSIQVTQGWNKLLSLI